MIGVELEEDNSIKRSKFASTPTRSPLAGVF